MNWMLNKFSSPNSKFFAIGLSMGGYYYYKIFFSIFFFRFFFFSIFYLIFFNYFLFLFFFTGNVLFKFIENCGDKVPFSSCCCVSNPFNMKMVLENMEENLYLYKKFLISSYARALHYNINTFSEEEEIKSLIFVII